MTDDGLERHLQAWFRAEIPVDGTAPAALRSRLAADPWVFVGAVAPVRVAPRVHPAGRRGAGWRACRNCDGRRRPLP